MLHPSTFAHLAGLAERPALPSRTGAAADLPLVIRHAAAGDEHDIARLAALEDRPELPAGERLIGELGGAIVAALDVRSGRAVADPFVPTRAIVELLGLRAAQVRQ